MITENFLLTHLNDPFIQLVSQQNDTLDFLQQFD